MLNPFRIRNLYPSSPHHPIDRSGVVQLSLEQYDQEIKEEPQAVLAYLDEDDGEIVTVSLSVWQTYHTISSLYLGRIFL